MRNTLKLITILSLHIFYSIALPASVVTLKVDTRPPVVGSKTNSLLVASNEVAQLIAFPNTAATELAIIKDGTVFVFNSNVIDANVQNKPIIFVGPATIELRSTSSQQVSLCSFSIESTAFAADKAVVIPQDAKANIFLECSTDLVTWNPAAPGTYTNVPSAKFFRIRAERIP